MTQFVIFTARRASRGGLFLAAEGADFHLRRAAFCHSRPRRTGNRFSRDPRDSFVEEAERRKSQSSAKSQAKPNIRDIIGRWGEVQATALLRLCPSNCPITPAAVRRAFRYPFRNEIHSTAIIKFSAAADNRRSRIRSVIRLAAQVEIDGLRISG